MARVTLQQAEKYYPTGGSNWFQLKNDGEVARVQFLMDTLDDIPSFSVHKIEVDGRDRYVDCLRQPGGPEDDCPFCAAGIPTKVVHVVQMYQHDDRQVKIWERGRSFLSKLQGLVNRYNPLSHKVFEIERHGKAGDQTTKYEIYPLDGVEAVDVQDLETPQLEGTLILQKSADEMVEYLEVGKFPSDSDGGAPVRRREAPSTGSARSVPATSTPQSSRASRASRREGSRGNEVF